jgi:hypothetical protein
MRETMTTTAVGDDVEIEMYILSAFFAQFKLRGVGNEQPRGIHLSLPCSPQHDFQD